MYINVGVGFKIKRNLPLIGVCTCQDIGIYTIKMSALSDISFSKISSKGGIVTTNSTSINLNNNILSMMS